MTPLFVCFFAAIPEQKKPVIPEYKKLSFPKAVIGNP